MGCFAVPTAAAIINHFFNKKPGKYKSWLTQLLLGGAIFGIIDHAWNGELLMISDNLLMDMLLGLTITVIIFLIWGLMVVYDKLKLQTPATS